MVLLIRINARLNGLTHSEVTRTAAQKTDLNRTLKYTEKWQRELAMQCERLKTARSFGTKTEVTSSWISVL